MRRCDPSSRWWIASVCLAFALAASQNVPAQQVVPGTNVNMVSGTTYPDGDPYLQRQNEPSSAVSTRNPLHILGGANDYRTVDVPFPSNSLIDVLRPQRMNSDAWVGLFKSFDGGQNWKSTLIPGYPQDPAQTAPLYGYDAATDPFVRAGTNGMFYYSGLAFDRGTNAPSAIFVARFMDMNNLEAGDPLVHLNTRIVDSDTGARFLDKNAIATDIARTSATCTFNVPLGDEAGTVVPQTIPAGNVYVAYTAFTGSGTTEQAVIMFSRSTDCGMTWSTPRALSTGSRLVQNAQIAVNPLNGHVYVSWRRFRYLSQDDAVMVAISTDGGATFGRSVRVAGIRPFDQPTATTIFRSNGFQTMTFDGNGRAYLAWSERGHATERPDPVTGDARIVISTSTNGSLWTVPQPVQRTGLGHQLMPVLSFHAGKLRLLYYDLREDISAVFAPFIDELDIITANSPVRHTLDVFVAQAPPGAVPVFTTTRLSDYAHGFFPDSEIPERLQFNPPNLPLFRQGTTPFMGDYIDLAPAPAYVQNPDGSWSHNTALGNAVSHAFWADNRDVRPPPDGDWTNYTPPRSPELGTVSRFNPAFTVPDCSPGHVASRNQNIYTARVTDGLFVSAPGNNKPLGQFQRAFVVVAENATDLIKTFRLTIDNQPPGGEASFLQFSSLTVLDVQVPPFSSVARSVFATSTDEDARIHVSIVEMTAPGGVPVAGGLSGSVVLNPEAGAPRLQSPRLQSPRLQSPLVAESYDAAITNALIAAPRLQSPRLQSPTIVNPRLQSDSAGNPRLQSDSAANPGVVSTGLVTSTESASITNPRLQSPRLQSVDLTNAAFSDTSWEITNDGNTTAAYTLNLVLAEPLPASFTSQLLVHKTTTTPAAIDCDLAERTNTVLLVNIPDPDFIDPSNVGDASNPRLQSPRLQSPTLALAPGESATLTLRVVDTNKYDGVTFDGSAAVIPAVVAHSVNTEDIPTTEQPSVAMPLTITTANVPVATPGQPYTTTLGSFAAVGTLSCQLFSGEMPQGLTLSSTGVISGTPTSPGNYRFTVRCTDANGSFDDQTLSLQVDPPVPAGFTASWNGATTEWADPLNWSPRGVPGPTARVYISASVPVVPTLTRNETIQDLFVEPGATVNTNGFELTITRNVNAGRTIVGAGTTILSGNGGSADGVFSNLAIRGRVILSGALSTTGNLTLGNGSRLDLNGQSLIVGGQLITTHPGGAVERVFPAVVGPASSFIVSGVSVDGLLLQNAPLTINGGTLSQFDDVSFNGFAPEAVQLTVNHAGLPDVFTMNALSFSTPPTSGRLVQANDTNDGPNTLVLDIFGAVPADGSAYTATAGGAVVNWLFNPGDANLAVVQSVSPVPAVAGSALTYTITVVNGGPAAATNVTLHPGIPFGATNVSIVPGQGDCTSTSGGWVCSLGTIAAGARVTTAATFVPAATGTFETTASVTATEADSVPTNNVHTIAATVVEAGAGVNLSIAKSASAAQVSINTPFTYSMTVTNAGANPASNVLVIDPVPSNVTIANPNSTQGTCAIVAGQVQCSLGTLSAGQVVTITLPATATAAGLVTNAAVVSSSDVELSPLNNVASHQLMVVATAACSAVTFTGPASFAGSPGPTAVVKLVDMNHDGHLDAVATHEIHGGGVDVFLNNGAGQFLAPRFTSTQTGPWLHVVADFNGDTHPDVIAATDTTGFPNPATLRLLTNDGTGTLTLVPTFSVPFSGGVETVDIDRDGDPDLVMSSTGGDVVLLRNDGVGNFAAPVTIFSGQNQGAGAFGDYNGDNRTDMVVALGAGGYAVLLADATGGFLPPVVHAVDGGALFVSAGDINGDGFVDLLIPEGTDEDSPTGRTSFALGNGAGGFGQAVEIATDNFFFPIVADLNRDGRTDLVAFSSLGSFEVRIGDGTGGFSAPLRFANANYYWPAVGDVNGDSRPDIAIGDRNGMLNVFLNNCGAAPTNLSVTVSESADPVNEGDALTYTVTVTNQTAAEATGVRLTSVLSPALTDDEQEEPNVEVLATTSSGGGTLTVSGRTYSWFLPTIPGNSTVTFVFGFRPLTGGTLELTSGVTSDGAETDLSDNAAFASTTVTPAGRNIEVTNTDDSGPGSLRQAIIDSNADSGDRDTIVFNIPGAGVRTITLLTPLPDLSEPVMIDGFSQPGSAAGTPLIELNGNGIQGSGLFVLAPGSTIRGLVINRFAFNGITVGPSAPNTVIEGNFIGTNAAGTAAQANLNSGVLVQSANNRIGGETAALRNVLSGNQLSGVVITGASASNNSVQNNYIGTNASGTGSVPNNGVQSGVLLSNGASNNTVANNVVSGNRQHGITVVGSTSNGNRIHGNFVGTDHTGMVLIGNGIGVGAIGVDIVSAQNTIVGDADGRNVIAGNTNAGIQMRTGASGTLVQNNYIGVNAAGTAAIGNGTGIQLSDAANGNTIGGAAGLGNVISGSTNSGVRINTNVTGTQVIGNRIGTDAAGTAALPNTHGVNITASNNSVLGNLISANAQNGIILGAVSTGNTIQGNLIGTDASGALDLGNGVDGVQVEGDGNLIGGTTAEARNVISGNQSHGVQLRTGASDNTVQGNYIGLNLAGTSAIGNGAYGVSIGGTGNTIGGTATGAGNVLSGNGLSGVNIAGGANPPATGNQIVGNRMGTDAAGQAAVPNAGQGAIVFQGPNTFAGNLISGNLQNGMLIAGNGLIIRGNLIGTNATGTSALPNGNHGISIGGNSQSNEVGGDVAGAGNVISGNTWDGVFLSGNLTAGNLIRGNLIGTNATGTAALGNRGGVVFSQGASANTVGGSTPAARNVISGNTADGILLLDSSTTDNSIAGNYIGTSIDGTGPIPNQADGVSIGGARDNVIGGTVVGTGNLIAFNGGNGIEISSGNGNRIAGNFIRDNVQLGIDLGPFGVTANDTLDADFGANNLQNFPVLTSATANGASLTIQGSLHSLANTTFRIELFGGGADPSGFGEGAVFLGALTVLTDANGNAPFTIELPGQGVTNVTATAEFDGNTSEFGPNVALSVGVQTFTVTNTTDSGPGSLRQAILNANASIGTRDTIAFNIPGTGPHAISPGSALPTITDPVVIDGTTEPDFDGAPVIELVGTNAGQATPGLNITAGNSVVRGLVINGFRGDGILISSGNGNLITGNYIGTDVTGTLARPNLSGGITTSSSNNVIGGATASLRNIVSGNASNGINLNGGSGNTIQGNYIGLDVTGTAPMSNGAFGISVFGSVSNRIGGSEPGEGNVVAAGTSINVSLQGGAHNNTVQGNRIGTNAEGTAVVGSNQNGVYLIGSNNNLIGGTVPGARNVIAGSNGSGQVVIGNGSSNNFIQGNYIGTNAAGTAALANDTWGIQVGGPNNTIGGTEAGAGNVISGNAAGGIAFFGGGDSNTVLGNLIGTAADGVAPVPNEAYGIGLQGPSLNSIGSDVGGGNVIAFNTGPGIAAPFGTRNQFRNNRIFANGGLGIDLGTVGVTANDAGDADVGANNLQNFPVLTAATASGSAISIQGTLNSTANTTFTVQIFRAAADPSGFGEGAQPLIALSITTNGSGTASFTTEVPSTGVTSLTATATDPNGNTSEFSANLAVALGPQTFVVTNTNDSGAGSLRQAILDANASTGTLDTITFDVSGTGPHTIAPLSALPTITDRVIIDGTSEPDFAGAPIIELNGENAGATTNGLTIATGLSTIRSLVINRFTARGISITAGGTNTITGCYIGTDVTGTIARPNLTGGIFMASSLTVIGGATPLLRNVISGNAGAGIHADGGSAHSIRGNYIGVDATGTQAIPNGSFGIAFIGTASGTIGGLVAGEGNVIAAHSSANITLQSLANGNTIQGNRIGTNAAGTAAVGSSGPGVLIQNASNNVVGGTAPGARNLVSGASSGAQVFLNAGATNNTVQGNYIGTNADGSAAIANNVVGVQITGSASNFVGGTAAGAGNLISGNAQSGISISGTGGTSIFGNRIGTAADGVTPLANQGNGILIATSTTTAIGNNLATSGNVIAFNALDGISITSGTQNSIRNNQIFSNGALGIDLGINGVNANDVGDGDAGANNLQNYPVLTSATSTANSTTIGGTLNSVANATLRIDFYTGGTDPSGFGEGATPIGSINVTTDATGNATFSTTVPLVVTSVTATATDLSGNTSEFSAARAATAGPQAFLVSNTDDGGPGSLRQAILDANASTGTRDAIAFAIPGGAPHTITLLSPLPAITDPLVIDGATQTGFNGTPIVEIDGSQAGPNGHGFVVSAGNTAIHSLIINNFGSGGSAEEGGTGVVFETLGNNVLEGNFIGTDATGTAARPNRGGGVRVSSGNNRIGAATAAGRNLISGNNLSGITLAGSGATGNHVLGNYIGTTASGVAALPNTFNGVDVDNAPGNLIGGSPAGETNVISANGAHGIRLAGTGATGNTILGNIVGLDVTGTADLGNILAAVELGSGASNNTIGGTAVGARNVLSGNGWDGVRIINSGTNGNVIQGNLIGTDVSGMQARPNSTHGIILFIDGPANTVIGGTAAGAGNVISGNAFYGVNIFGGVGTGSPFGTIVQGNLIGLNANGEALANGAGGIFIGQAANNLVGGDTAVARNVISGNLGSGVHITDAPAPGNVVIGNYIGTSRSGNFGIGNSVDGVNITNGVGNRVGGTNAGERNVISANGRIGVLIDGPGSTQNLVQGNYIGTDAGGVLDVGNLFDGVNIGNGSNNTIGGPGTARNVISGNDRIGVLIEGASATGNTVQGNFVGTAADGVAPLGNMFDGVFVNSPGNSVGGVLGGTGNVIASNGRAGVYLETGSGTTAVAGNFIGINAAGQDAGNATSGVLIFSGANVIGGTAAGAGNIIAGNGADGVAIVGATAVQNRIEGNQIGVHGGAPIPNAADGVRIDAASGNTVGGSAPNATNIIAANTQHGVGIYGGATGNQVYGNRIGTAPGLGDVGNGLEGVQIFNGSNNLIGSVQDGQANTIGSNGRNGVAVLTGTGNRIRGNAISANDALGIDLGLDGVTLNDNEDTDGGPNNLQNFPILTSAVEEGQGVVVQGTLTSTPNTVFQIDFYGDPGDPSGHGEGAVWAGSVNVVTNADGFVSFQTEVVPGAGGNRITATATDPNFNTSEFSAYREISLPPQTFVVSNTDDSGPGSLRQAILDSNATVGVLDSIGFSLPGQGPHSIALLSPLPTVSDPVVIDGTTEPDYAGVPLIELDGTSAGGNADGLRIGAANSTVRGLIINRFGTGGSGDGGAGLVIDGANTILENNIVGTDQSQLVALPNRTAGVVVTSSGNQIGTSFAQPNVISGNGGAGVVLEGPGATGNLVQGNFIGARSGGAGIPNAAHGVLIHGASSNTVGSNVIAFNGGDGIGVSAGSTNNLGGNTIFSNAGLGIDLGQIVDFENQPDEIPVGTPFPTSYQGITWNNWLHAAPYRAEFLPAGLNALYGAIDGASFTFSPRVFSGAHFSRWVGGPGAIFFELYRAGQLVWTSDQLNDVAPALTFLPSGYAGLVDEVRVRSLGQSMTPAGGTWVMDNITFDDGPTANDDGDADAGPNELQNHPVLTAMANGVQVALNSTPNTLFRIDLFINSVCDPSGSGEGEHFLGSLQLTTDATGNGNLFFPIGAGAIVTTTATSLEGSTSEFSPCAITQASEPADLSITKTAVDSVVVNTPFTYTLTVANGGPGPATNISVTDVLPVGVTVTTATSTVGACAIQPGAVVCTIPSLLSGGTAEITLAATASQLGLITNQAFVFASEGDPNFANNSATQQTMVLAFAACAAPSLSGPVLYSAGGTPVHLASGDFNEDGAADLVVSHPDSSQVGVLLSNGAGGFIPAAPVVVAAGASSGARNVTAVDTNNDGHLDLVVSNTAVNTITVATGDGDGGFVHTFTSDVLAGTPGKITAAHFSEDGQVDVLVETPAGASMLLGDGAGGFGAPVIIGSFTNTPLFAGHFNTDNHLDVVFGSSGGPTVRVFNGNGLGGFTNVTIYPTNVASRVVGVADVTGDARADVLLESLLTPGALTLLHSTTTGLGVETGIGTGLFLSQIADVNGDGRQDLVVSGSVSVLMGDGDGTFSAPLRLAETPSADAAGDFNGDGRVDFAGMLGDSVGILLNTCGQPATNLSVQLADELDPVNEGASNTYTATITNTGTVGATGVRMSVSVEAGSVGLTFSGVDPACGVQGNGLLCNIGPVPAGSDRVLEFNVTAAGATTVNVRASVTSEQADTNASDNSDLEPTTVNGSSGTLTVTNTNDSGAGSLRQAILDSNSDSGDIDRVVFAISGAGPHTINLASALPIITQPIEIDGTTQLGYAGTPVVELNGAALAGIPQAGLNITAGNSTIRGLAINRFSGDAIVLSGAGGNAVYSSYVGLGPAGNADLGNAGNGILIGGSPNNIVGGPGQGNVIAGNNIDGIRIGGIAATGNVIANNRIGTNATGTTAIPNNTGVFVTNSAGTTTIGPGNLISGNNGIGLWVQGGSSGAVIQGNTIGLSADGTADLGNGFDGILVQNVTAGATIGGPTTAARNVISGNGTAGVRLTGNSANVAIQGNYIGTNAAGSAAVGNSEYGVRVEQTANGNTIGGTAAGAGNVISGNVNAGVLLVGVNNTLVQGNRIGTDDLSTTSIGNGGGGVVIQEGSQNTIGGATAEARNVISGNGSNGIFISTFGGGATGNVVQNNFIGTNGSAMSAIQNLNHGIRIDNATDTRVGPDNVISGNAVDGINVFGPVGSSTLIIGNRIGTNFTATGTIPNNANGVQLNTSNVAVGGSNLGDGNTIGGNGQNGIFIGNGGTGNIIRGNTIGLHEPPNDLGNALDGIRIQLGSNNTIGGSQPQDANTIAFNDGNGVAVQGGTGNQIVGNSIANNDSLGIDLNRDGITNNDAGDGDAGPNNRQNFPVLSAVPGGVGGVLNSQPNTIYLVHYYTNTACDPSGHGEGQTYLATGSLTTDANGGAALPFIAASAGQIVTATAMDPGGNTSEFSACVTAPEADLPTVTLTASDPAAAEANSDPATFTFTRTGPTTLPLEVHYSVSGNNIGGDDYTPALTATVTIPAGLSSFDLTLTPVNDAEPEGPQVLILTLATTGTPTYHVGTPSSGTMTIADDDEASAVRTWISDSDGFWDVPGNWSGGVVPQEGEHVVIDRPAGAFTITVRTGVQIGSLSSAEHVVIQGTGSLLVVGNAELHGGLTMSGVFSTQASLTLGATSLWTAGNLVAVDGMTILAGSTLSVDTPGLGGILMTSITNNGRLIWNQTSLSIDTGVRIVNNAGGVFEIQGSMPIVGGGAPTMISNAGTLLKSGPLGPLTLNGVPFVNTGTLVTRLGASDNDRINTDGAISLGGTLDVRLDEAFVPTVGAQFPVVTAANGTLSGTFATVNGNGQVYLTEYSPTGLTLTAQGGVITSFAAWHPAATGPLRIIDFETAPTLPTGTILAGNEYETRGLSILQRDGDPMRIVAAGDGTFASTTNFNSQTHGVSSSAAPGFPGGLDNTRSENYDFVFTRLVQSAGVWIGNLNAEPTVTVQFLDGAGNVLQSFQPTSSHPHLIAGAGGPLDNRLFVGIHASTPINRIRVINAANDNDGILFDDVVFISNVAPVANAGPDQSEVPLGSPVTLDGRLSSDADGDTLTYSWEFVARPSGSAAVLSDANAATPSFTPDQAGMYRLRLVVSDGFALVEDTVDVTTVAPPEGEQVAARTTGVSYYNPARIPSPDSADSTRASLSYYNPAQIPSPGGVLVANRASLSYYNPARIPSPNSSDSAGASLSYYNPAQIPTGSGRVMSGVTSVSYHNPPAAGGGQP